MENSARIVIGLGLLLVIGGGVLLLLGKLGINVGHLPGDIHVEGESRSFHFPVVTCVLVSIVLTIVLNLLLRWWR